MAASASISWRSSQFLGESALRSSSSTASTVSRVGFGSPQLSALRSSSSTASTVSRVGFGSPRVAASAAYTTAESPLQYGSLKRAFSTSLYDVLGITAGATRQEIKAAYRRLARVCHPDVRKDTSAEVEFMRIQAAYSTLSDPSKRANYDLMYRPRVPMRTPLSFSGCSRRTWETDQCW